MKHDANSRNVEEMVILSEKRKKILNKLGKVLKNWNTMKYLIYETIQLFDSKIEARKWTDLNY